MRERPNRHDWKSCVGQPTVGSNPTLSASQPTNQPANQPAGRPDKCRSEVVPRPAATLRGCPPQAFDRQVDRHLGPAGDRHLPGSVAFLCAASILKGSVRLLVRFGAWSGAPYPLGLRPWPVVGDGGVTDAPPIQACQKAPQVPNLTSTTLLDGGSGSLAASTTKTTPLAAFHLFTPAKRSWP